MQYKKQDLGQYTAETSGKQYTVILRIKQILHKPIAGEAILKDGSRDFVTACGKGLNPIDDEHKSFEIVQSGVVIKKDTD